MSRIRRYAAAIAVCALLCATARSAAADDDYFGGDSPDEDIQFRLDKPRTSKQRLILASLFGSAVVFGGAGLGFHLHSRSTSNDISSVAEHTRRIYDESVEDSRKSALRSRAIAIVGYSIGGALVVAGAVALYLTEPGTKVVTVGQEKEDVPAPTVPVSRLWVSPTEDGAMVGTGWRF